MGVGEYKCDSCGFLDYDDYGVVRNYLESHKGATTAEISAMTGISQKEINTMLREERFEIAADSRSFLKCKGCGTEIRSGMYCPTCGKIAEAAEAKKRREEEAEERRRNLNMSGTGAKTPQPGSGAKRFTRDK